MTEDGSPNSDSLVPAQNQVARSTARQIDGDLARAIVGATTDTILILDAMGRILFITSGYQNVLGQPADRWVGYSAFDLIYPDDLPQVLTRFKAAIAGRPRPGDYVHVRLGTGQEPWLFAELHGFTPIPFEQVPAVLVSVRDYSGDLGARRGYSAARRTLDAAMNGGDSIDNRKAVVEQYLPRKFRGLSVALNFLIVMVKAEHYDSSKQTYGNEEALRAMSSVGLRLLATSRQDDMVVRFNEGEFLIACDDIGSAHNAASVVRRIRASADSAPGSTSLSLTVGYAIGSVGDDYAELVAHAASTATASPTT